MNDARPRSFQFSIRMIMAACAVVALALVPVTWVARERQQMLRLQHEILRAREMALASVVREEASRRRQAVAAASSSSVSIDELKKENERLRDKVAKLQDTVQMLKSQYGKRDP